MVKVNTLTIFAIRDALIDNVKKYGPGAGFAFKIKRSDITLTHPRVELGGGLGAHSKSANHPLFQKRTHHESKTSLIDCKRKAAGIQQNIYDILK